MSLREQPLSAQNSPVPALPFQGEQIREPGQHRHLNNWGLGRLSTPAFTLHGFPLQLEAGGLVRAVWSPLRPCGGICPSPHMGFAGRASCSFPGRGAPFSASVSARGPPVCICVTCIVVTVQSAKSAHLL